MRYAFLIIFMVFVSPAWSQENVLSEAPEHVTKAEFDALKARLEEVERELAKLKEQLAAGAQTEEYPATGTVVPEVLGGGSTSGIPQTLLPDISVVGNVVGKVASDKSDVHRNTLMVREAEVAFQGYLYPQIRADAFVALEDEHSHVAELDEHSHVAELEEGYISFLQLGNTSLNCRLGKMRLNFGKVNAIHPHHWQYVEAPAAVSNFLGDHGLIAQGGSIGWLLPSHGKFFASVEAGAWTAHQHSHDGHEEHAFGPGFDDKLYTARLHASHPVTDDSEIEAGFSWAHGTGLREDDSPTRDGITLRGFDLTFKKWPAAHKRLMLQAELLCHRRAGDSRSGYYVLGNYQWSKYWDGGLRYDWAERPSPERGRDSGFAFVLTRHLTETTSLRLHYAYGSRSETGTVHEAFLQAIWGIGPHSHPLE